MEMKQCFICGRVCYTERHHIFNGAYRTKSDINHLTVDLCHDCHNEPPYGAHHNPETMLYLKQYGQRVIMEREGWTTDDFIREFGQNYL